MKDFSLLYGPARTWLPIIAVAVLGVVVFLSQSSAEVGACGDGQVATAAGCPEPLVGDGQLLVDGDTPPPTARSIGLADGSDGAGGGAEADGSDDPWGQAPGSGREVPFVSLEPSPEPMTDAGEDLVRSAEASRDDG